MKIKLTSFSKWEYTGIMLNCIICTMHCLVQMFWFNFGLMGFFGVHLKSLGFFGL